MASRIPEEILREILQHSLSIWPVDAILTQPLPSLTKRVEDNRNCSERSDLDKGLPQPDPLLVCKRWLRVGTLLFYHTIVLFDKPQVQQIANTFCTNPLLALLVRNLRLAGGYGKDLEAVIFTRIRISRLFISGDRITIKRRLMHSSRHIERRTKSENT